MQVFMNYLKRTFIEAGSEVEMGSGPRDRRPSIRHLMASLPEWTKGIVLVENWRQNKE